MAATIDIIGKNGIKHSAVYEESSVRKFELMKEDYVRLVFSTDKKFAVSLGDYITLEDWGTFYITKPQKPTYNLTTGGYDYDLQFDAPHYRWNNKLYKFEPNTNRNEASWSLTDNLQNHMAVFLRNLEHHGWNYTVDTNSYQLEAANRYIYIQFDNCYLLDALTKIAEAFGVEWWITDNIIHFGKAENGAIVDFEVGVNVQEMGSENSNKEYFTRIYAFGSTQNIPSGYRKNDEQLLLNGVVQKRVMLPASTPYVDIEEGLTDEEIVEGIVIFDDVYPRLDNSITDLRSDEREVEKTDTVEAGDGESSDESETETVTIYRFKDSSLTFSKDYILPGVQLQVQFQSGKLNGMIFDLAFNPDDVSEETPDGQWFEIVRNDTYGVMLPNDILKPAKTDKFVLLGWDVTKLESGLGLITAAENEVLARANEYAEKLQTDSNTYPCHMMSDYMFGLNNRGQQDSNFTKVRQFPLGQRIRLNNSNFFVGGSRVSRVVGYEYKLDKPYDDAVIYVGESATYSSKQAQEAKINEAMDAINYRGGGSGSNVYIITSNDNTTPTDGKVFSALKTERRFARKDADDNISSLWTFNNGHGARRGIQTHEYNGAGANEDNLFGHGFELITKTDGNGNQKSRLEIDELFVRIKAFFASLEIREISYLGGNYAFSSAGSKIYHVEWLDGLGNVLPKLAGNISSVATFRCYLYSDDGTTATMNKWAVDDQIMCQTFNIDEGVHTNTSNKYYWRRCTGIGKGVITDDDTNTEYQYVDISMSDCAINSDYPEDEDTIVQFGNWTNSARQGLIYLKVEGADAPAIIEYSGVGANGNHFVLPDPTLQLSPNRNIIYGEFHSIVNGSDDKVGDGETIDDQLRALIDALNDIKNQADQKFDIWFGVGVPLPNTDNPNATANYPASDWPTDALKALHAQDIFYDTNREPASTGGRAWRWIAYELNGVVHYRWDEITDADTLASLEQISDVASDGKLTGGAEKTRVFVDWQQAVDYYWQYKVRSEDQRVLTEWTAYHNAFVALGTLLNGGNTLTKDSNGAWKTPSWLVDLSTTTEIPSAQDYRDAWNAYYAALAALIQKVSKVAQDEIDTITADGILSSVEKKQVRKEWEEVVRSFTRNSALATIFDVSSSDYGTDSQGNDIVAQYNLAYAKLGNYLDGCSNPESTSAWTWVVGRIPKWLAYDTETGYVEGQGMGDDTEIVPATYRSYWVNYYDLENAVLNAISEIAKHAGDEALAKLEEIADDGVITPSEKNTILIQWLEIAKEFPLLVAQADAFISDASGATMVTALTNAKNTYVTRFNTLANYLNNGDYTYTLNPVNIPLPLWIDASHIGNSEELSTSQKAAFKDVWENYFSSRTSLQEVFAEASKEPGKDALGELDNLADDDILTPFEKLTVLREWDAITTEKTDLLSKAATAHVSTSDYVLRYNVLGNYLNDPVASDERDITTPFSGTPAALLTDGNTTIRGTQFKTNWSLFYNERTKLLSAISTSKVSYFVSVDVPTPPYHVGDIWMRLANSSDTKGKMYICVVDNETSTGRLADWADMSEITRDPFVILSKVANEAWEFMGGYIRERGYINIFVARTAPSGTIGDIFYNATNNTLYQYADDGWESVSRATLLNLGSALYQILGIHTFRVYSSTVANPNKYDMCVRNITFTDPLSGQTIQGNLNILAYTDGNWITLQDSTKAMIENYANQLNSYMFGSENGYIKASGMVTKTNITELFAVVNDPDSGDIVTKAYLQVYTDDFVDANGVRQIISGVRISADKIDLTGTDSISLGINGIKSGLANTGINIQEGKIMLNAENTVFNGNIRLTNPNEGIIIYDSYNNEKISVINKALGSLGNFDFGSEKYYGSSKRTSRSSSGSSLSVAHDSMSIGTFAAGQKMDLHEISVEGYFNSEPFDTEATLNYSYEIQCKLSAQTTLTSGVYLSDGTYKASGSVLSAGTVIKIVTKSGNNLSKGSDSNRPFSFILQDYVNNSVGYSGEYFIVLSNTYNFIGNSVNLTGTFISRFSLYCQRVNVNTGINRIGTDGAVFASSGTKFNWFGSDNTILRNENNAIKIDSSGLFRKPYNVIHPSNKFFNSDTWGDISSMMPYAYINGQSYTATLKDAVIIFAMVLGVSNPSYNLYLPSPADCPGKVYYVKNIADNASSTNIQVSGETYMMNPGDTGMAQSYNIGKKSAIIVSVQWAWAIFYCG